MYIPKQPEELVFSFAEHPIFDSKKFQFFKLFGYKFFLLLFFLASSCILADEPEKTPPLAVYLSWQDDPTTTMIIKWITSEKEETTHLQYTAASALEWKDAIGESSPFPFQEPYILHTVYLSNLAPNTLYTFRIDGITHSFRTMPKNLDEPVSFIIGGDINLSTLWEKFFKETLLSATSHDPSFVAIGGDLACPVIKKEKEEVSKWLILLKIWYQTAQKNNVLIPLLVTIGNHDVQGKYDQSLSQAPYFSFLFLGKKTSSYSLLHFGTYLTLYLLDSGHAAPCSGEQATWLTKALASNLTTLHRIAIYHVSAYPPYRHYNNPYSSAIRQSWIPIFDTFRLHLAFENHEHTYKRTYPLTNNTPTPRGVVYVGNGSFGVKPRVPINASQTIYLEKDKQIRGFCLVRLFSTKREVLALSYDNILVDIFSQPTDAVAAEKRQQEEFELWKKTSRK